MASKRPKTPVIYRMRPDLIWQDVVNNWKEDKTVPSGITAPSVLKPDSRLVSVPVGRLALRKRRVMKYPRGYWKKPENLRKFFCEYAQLAGFDPLQPENWARVTNRDIMRKKVNGGF